MLKKPSGIGKKIADMKGALSVPANRLLALFIIEGILFQYAASLNGYANNIYATNLGATDSQISLNQMLPNIIAVALMLPCGIIGDRMKSRKTFPALVLIFMGIMYIFFGSVPLMGENKMAFYFVFMGLSAGCVAIYNAQWQTLFAEIVPARNQNSTIARRSQVMGALGTLVTLVCGMVLSGMESSDQKIFILRLFYYSAAIMVFLQAFVVTRMREPAKTEKQISHRFKLSDFSGIFRTLFGNKQFVSFFICIIFFYIGWHSDWTMWYIGQTKYVGFNEAQLSYFQALGTLMQFVGIGVWAMFIRKKGVHFTFLFGILGLALCPLMMMFCASFPGNVGVTIFIVVGSVLNFTQASVGICVVQMLIRVVPETNRATSISFYTMVITLSNSLMPYIGVQIYTALGADIEALYLFNGGAAIWRFVMLGVFLFRYIRRRKDLNAA